ncbi:AP-3 complex subunit mu [Talaromyces islandicus]|uniref:AP-3 complex subunit mu n=1 Tax=Talaromyces islandicus TaxID=28573 RepID=A0A0U1LWI0_TALIS|nr:AP-3 complex subunit mu [Talaromyces islandicus]
MSGAIKALYIYDEYNAPILEHTYRSRLPSASSLIRLFLAHPAPRPSLIYLPEASPPVTVFSIVHSNLLFLSPSDVDTEPLLVLEFLRRVVDVLEEFVGAPLLATKLQTSYDVVAQLLTEMCDAGLVSSTEINSLQENVETPNWMNKLLSGVGLPGTSSPGLTPLNPRKAQLPGAAATAASGPAIPWRRPGVRHTSNELYVDIIETLSVTIAPSGRLLSALVSGTIAFTAKISGVPDLLLALTTPGGQRAINQKMELPVFHPCVRLARWRERPGELSFVPPDGRFILAGYEVDLLPIDPDIDAPPRHMEKLFLPAFVDIKKSLGPTGKDFEVRLTLNTNFPGANSGFRPSGGGRNGSGGSTPSFLGVGSSANSLSTPSLEEVVVHVPVPKAVRNITDMRPSRGETIYSPGDNSLEWRIPTKDAGTVSGTATLRCTVLGYQDDLDEAEAELAAGQEMLQGYYDADSYQQDPTAYTAEAGSSGKPKKPRKPKSSKTKKTKKTKSKKASTAMLDPQSTLTPSKLSPSGTPPPQNPPFREAASRKEKLLSALMPTSATVSFSVKGWLPSGIRVESLNIDPRKSRGMGEGVRPYKGVKYLCVSRKGVERRC